MGFFLSPWGQFFWQTILHSCLTALVIETIIRTGRIRKPLLQIRLRSISLWLPITSLSILHFAYPGRSGLAFRQTALFDSNQWLSLRLWGEFSFWHIAAAVIAVTTIFFLFRELAPAIRYWIKRQPRLSTIAAGKYPALDTSLARLAGQAGLAVPEALVEPDALPTIYAIGNRALAISESAINLLDAAELEAVIAHELAHFRREVRLSSRLNLVWRFLMFYNPAAMLVYHRLNHDAERLCDDIAVSLTGRPLALASGLLKILRSNMPQAENGRRRRQPVSRKMDSLEDHAHLALAGERARRLLLGEMKDERARRLLRSEMKDEEVYQAVRVAVTACLLMILLFFVV